VSLTVLLTTVGRPSLARTLESLRPQDWGPGDEVIVVSDDRHDAVSRAVGASGLANARHEIIQGGPHNDWGHTPRNLAMPLAGGTHLWHFDDDDVVTRWAVRQIHLDLSVDPACVHLYRFIRQSDSNKTWTMPPQVAVNHVGTPCVVHPNVPATFGTWRPKVGGDGDFIAETCAKVGRHTWHDCVVGVVGPPAGWDVGRCHDWMLGSPTPRKPGSTQLARLIDARFSRGRSWSAPQGCGVVAASDDACLPGLQLLWHSLSGRCPLAVADLGLSRKALTWLGNRVHLLSPSGPFARGRPAWQTWNKPWYVESSPFKRTLWLDCDTLVVGDLNPLFDWVSARPLAVRHWDAPAYQGGIGDAFLKDCPTHYDSVPGGAVNAGVLGFDVARDSALLHSWQYACFLAARRPELAPALRWFDESALNWALRAQGRFDCVSDVRGWNRLTWHRKPTYQPQDFVQSVPAAAGDVVLHFSVKEKPWTRWQRSSLLWE
jgi:hypothetical protein